MKKFIMLVFLTAFCGLVNAQNITGNYTLSKEQSDDSVLSMILDENPIMLFQLMIDSTSWRDNSKLIPKKIKVSTSSVVFYNSKGDKVEYTISSIDKKHKKILLSYNTFKDEILYRINKGKNELVWHKLVFNR